MLVHGSPTSSVLFRHQIETLSRSFRIIAPDLLGFGQSDVPTDGTAFGEQAGVLRALLDHLGLERYAGPAQIGAPEQRAVLGVHAVQVVVPAEAGTTAAPGAGASTPAAALQVLVNGRAVSSFAVQLDALQVMVSRPLSARLGLKVQAGPELILRTPEGFFPSRLAEAGTLALGGASASRVLLVVVGLDRLPQGVECVIGQSFLTRFSVEHNVESGVLQLASFGGQAPASIPASP